MIDRISPMGRLFVAALRQTFIDRGRLDLARYVDDHAAEIEAETEGLIWSSLLPAGGVAVSSGASIAPAQDGFEAALEGRLSAPPTNSGVFAYTIGYTWGRQLRTRPNTVFAAQYGPWKEPQRKTPSSVRPRQSAQRKRAARAPTASRRTGCSCGSREYLHSGSLVPSPRNCWHCRHDD